MDYKKIKEDLFKINEELRTENGLYRASKGIDYMNFIWIRDVYYQVKPNMKNNPVLYIETYKTLLKYLIGLQAKYDCKIDYIIKKGRNAVNSMEFIHPRFNINLSEITSDWGNMQIDALGYLLLGIAEGMQKGLKIITNTDEVIIVQKVIDVLEAIEYWHCPDNGIWEENVEVHLSSVGAALGGLKAIKNFGFLVKNELIQKGQNIINNSDLRESETKDVDLALLTLIYPFNVLTKRQTLEVIEKCDRILSRKHGLIRYQNDTYYNLADHARQSQFNSLTHKGFKEMRGNEAEWCFGFIFLAMSLFSINHYNTAKAVLDTAIQNTVTEEGVPELFYSKTDIPNDNIPLGWATSMLIYAIDEIVL